MTKMRLDHLCATTRLNRFERALQIVDFISDSFHAHRKPDERICNAQFFALLLRNRSMRHERGMIDEAFHAAQTFRQRKQARVLQKTPGAREIAFQNDRYDSAEAAHLLPRQIVLWMRF